MKALVFVLVDKQAIKIIGQFSPNLVYIFYIENSISADMEKMSKDGENFSSQNVIFERYK